MSQACFDTERRGRHRFKRSTAILRQPAEAFPRCGPETRGNGAMAGEAKLRQAIGTRNRESPIPARAGNLMRAAIPGRHR